MVIPASVTRLIGVYDADGTLRGELSYVWGKVRGTAHCGLCDVTHSPVRRKRAWDRFVASLPVPVELVHRDEQDESMRIVTEGRLPAVLAEIDDPASGEGRRLVELLGPADLDALAGDVTAFAAAIERAAADPRWARVRPTSV
jgi:hypothetical protein